VAIVGDKRGRLEPGRIDVLVDLGFDPGKDLIPDAAAGHVAACACHHEPLLNRRPRDFRPCEAVSLPGVYSAEPLEASKNTASAAFAP
jgi:hypothetical protein